MAQIFETTPIASEPSHPQPELTLLQGGLSDNGQGILRGKREHVVSGPFDQDKDHDLSLPGGSWGVEVPTGQQPVVPAKLAISKRVGEVMLGSETDVATLPGAAVAQRLTDQGRHRSAVERVTRL